MNTTNPDIKDVAEVSELFSFEEKIIFNSRYLLVPLYFGLIIVSILYCVKFSVQLWEFVLDFRSLDESKMMLAALTFVDMTMVANLVNMVCVGSHSAFVNDMTCVQSCRRKPQWLNNISSGLLKIKMGTSLVGVTSIHLARSFMDAGNISNEILQKQIIIHVVFIVSSLVLAVIEHITHKDHH